MSQPRHAVHAVHPVHPLHRRTARLAQWLPLLGAAVLLAACGTAGPDHRVPDDAAARRPAANAAFSALAPSTQPAADAAQARPYTPAPLPDRWWQLYDDPALNRLVREALARNADLRQAAANLERVRALEDETRGAARPSVSLGGGPSYGHVSGLSLLQPGAEPPADGHYSASMGLSYPLDLAGQIRRASEAAQAGTEAAAAALDMARVAVAAGTARAYAELCSGGARLKSARRSVALQTQAVDVSSRLQRAGRAGTLDLSRARSQLQQLQAALPPLHAQRQGALARLAALTGRAPGEFDAAGIAGCERAPSVAGLIPVGDGAQLLRRRPDVRQAERELAAATARIGVAVTDRYPKVSLGLSASSAGTLDGVARRDTWAWSLGPLISWTLPNNGVADARIAQAEAGSRMALAKFDGTVLAALRETETALSAYAHELDRRAALRASRDEAADVAGQARRLYQGGKVAYMDALDAERSLAAGEAALAASEAQLAEDQIALFLALGGGWQPEATH